ncbi:MAG TPA: LytR C-terminal domain-containing protein [Thermoleophilaceae bacterium]|nr:LytR C-terminal domain-containing protein [Thermoleophilaceae bacterium]
MEILQEIGSYAGFAAILGLAVLSALYFSQARDVKRLREWAGRAPERGPSPAVAEPRGVVAQPIARTPSRPVPGGTPPPVPRPPGAQPATPAAAAAAGATPAVAHGPAVEDDEDELDVTAMDTVVHPPPLADDEADDDELEAEDELDEGPDDEIGDGFDDDPSAEGVDAQADDEFGDSADAQEPDDTGEWRPEDEHSDIDFTDEHDAVPAPATPAASVPRPPIPPRPYQRRAATATGQGRDRVPILPPYAETQAQSEPSPAPARGRRPVLLAVVAMVVIALGAFALLQVTGGDDSGGGDDVGLSSGATTGGGGASDDGGGSDAPPIVPADVTVAVLNGTTVPGLAATIGDKIVGEGFQLGTVTNNFDQERAESVVLYAPGAEREAADVSRRLDIAQREAIDAESQALAGDATVVVVAGADQNQ